MQPIPATPDPKRAPRGTIMSMMVVVSVVITGLVMTMAWAAGLQAKMTSGYTQVDRAFFAAESGAQRVAWFAKNRKLGTITSPLTGTIGGFAYSTSWQTVSGNIIRITSTGSLGSVSDTCYLTVTPPPLVLPTFSSGGDFDNKNVDITGDVVTGGNYSNSGSGSLSGDLTYAGTAVNVGSVGGTVTKDTYTPLDIARLLPLVQSYAGTSYSGTQTNRTFDFTTVSGVRKVIYVNGDVVNPTFVGAGTLVVNGNVSNVGSFGTATTPVNIIADGSISTNGNATFYGTFYASGAWNRQKMKLVGLVYVNGISPANAGASTMIMTGAPWFDPRIDPAGRILTKFTQFTGPQP